MMQALHTPATLGWVPPPPPPPGHHHHGGGHHGGGFVPIYSMGPEEVYSPEPIYVSQPDNGSDALQLAGLIAIPVAALALLVMAFGGRN